MVSKPTGRPRGRPKGSKNIPKMADLVRMTLADPPKPPPKPKKARVRGVWANMTPEERSEYARKIRAGGVTNPNGKPKGLPNGFTKETFAAFRKEQEEFVAKVVKKMIADGEIPKSKEEAATEAFLKAGTIMRTTQDERNGLAAARLILDFSMSKPSQRVEHTVKTPEEMLDEIADD